MIKINATAPIYHISEVTEIASKNGGTPFRKRELVLNDQWVKDNVTHPNLVSIEFAGDRVSLLDGYAPGQTVTVEAMVTGREHNGRYFVTLRGMGIQPVQVPQAPGFAPPAYPPQLGYQHAPASPPQPQSTYPQPQAPQGYQPNPAQPLPPDADNLPF